VNRGIAEYSDIMQHWDINEVMTANEWLDIRDDMEWLDAEEQRQQMKKASRR